MGGDTAPSTIPRSPRLYKTGSARQAQIRSRHILPKIQSITKLSQNRRYLEHPLRSQYPATEGNTSYHTTPDRRVHVSTTCLLHVPHQPNPNRLQIWTATLKTFTLIITYEVHYKTHGPPNDWQPQKLSRNGSPAVEATKTPSTRIDA